MLCMLLQFNSNKRLSAEVNDFVSLFVCLFWYFYFLLFSKENKYLY